ncbi:MAG: leucine-rich repeat domain-containing protein [Ruminococcus sp.]|nr:leucine-rich repeat domain-containing protein [Ruminococcus sp.]
MKKRMAVPWLITAAVLLFLIIRFIILPSPESSFNYDINEDGTVTVTFYAGSRPYVKIPEKKEGRTVTAVGYADGSRKSLMGKRSFEEQCIIRAVTLPDSFKIIGDDAFALLFNLSYINFPDSLEYIGRGAFWDADIKSAVIPDSVKP